MIFRGGRGEVAVKVPVPQAFLARLAVIIDTHEPAAIQRTGTAENAIAVGVHPLALGSRN